ncbi:hypothetical protein AMTR_s00179p00038200 [Amborella trichopoda]|uniref:Uncharacterized protein n=1 Tax=Amborella trichopoda TaxID=13333 RepID=W1PYW2_AMBTC|nr:hypothetical protein AMTR_s00179p00038200 [Amborella trichopoda]
MKERGLAYRDDETKPLLLDEYPSILDGLIEVDWYLKGLEDSILILPLAGHYCMTLAGSSYCEGYYPECLGKLGLLRGLFSICSTFDHQPFYPNKGSSQDPPACHLELEVSLELSQGASAIYEAWWDKATPTPFLPFLLEGDHRLAEALATVVASTSSLNREPS